MVNHLRSFLNKGLFHTGFCLIKTKKATDKVALISERYLAGGLSCLLKASLDKPSRLFQSNLTWRWNYADKFHLNHSVGTPIQF